MWLIVHRNKECFIMRACTPGCKNPPKKLESLELFLNDITLLKHLLKWGTKSKLIKSHHSQHLTSSLCIISEGMTPEREGRNLQELCWRFILPPSPGCTSCLTMGTQFASPQESTPLAIQHLMCFPTPTESSRSPITGVFPSFPQDEGMKFPTDNKTRIFCSSFGAKFECKN